MTKHSDFYKFKWGYLLPFLITLAFVVLSNVICIIAGWVEMNFFIGWFGYAIFYHSHELFTEIKINNDDILNK